MTGPNRLTECRRSLNSQALLGELDTEIVGGREGSGVAVKGRGVQIGGGGGVFPLLSGCGGCVEEDRAIHVTAKGRPRVAFGVVNLVQRQFGQGLIVV